MKPIKVSYKLNASCASAFKLRFLEPLAEVNWSRTGCRNVSLLADDFTVGGERRYCLEVLSASRLWMKHTFIELRPNEQVAFLESYTDKEGVSFPCERSVKWPSEFFVEYRFEAWAPGSCLLHLTYEPYKSNPRARKAFDEERVGTEEKFLAEFALFNAFLISEQGRKHRLSYKESCQRLMKADWMDVCVFSPEVWDGLVDPPVRASRPLPSDLYYDGIEIFKTYISGKDRFPLENMTLPRTFINRSEVSDLSFANTDLAESFFCWNDFLEVNFSNACLRSVDFRSCDLDGVNFSYADLRDADFRQSAFHGCCFLNANMKGTKFLRRDLNWDVFSRKQIAEIIWCEDDGEVAPGG